MPTLNHEVKYGFPSMQAAGWADLRQTLVDWLPPNSVLLGKHFVSFDQHDDHVVTHFADSSSIASRVVIGADGVFSKVRQQNLCDGLPESTVSARPWHWCACIAVMVLRCWRAPVLTRHESCMPWHGTRSQWQQSPSQQELAMYAVSARCREAFHACLDLMQKLHAHMLSCDTLLVCRAAV